ncbi:MAG: hypothetical protein OXI59_04475, partial [Gemmatimonadota bacterium]|nr:hypothetical protein [Gemmatimonadota bacterium]
HHRLVVCLVGVFVKTDRSKIDGRTAQHATGDRIDRVLEEIRKNPKLIQDSFFNNRNAIVEAKGFDGLHTLKTRNSLKSTLSLGGQS